jgi:hypothetical protein
MSRGLDQYLANRLTNEHLFQVVTDSKMADAVFTDHIGDPFQTQMEALFPPPPVEKPEKKEVKEKKDRKEKGDKDGEKDDDPKGVTLATETVNKLSSPSLSGFGRAKGTVFLVDAKSRQVVWSVYDPPKGSANNDMDRIASDIVSRLKKELNPKTKN